MVLEKEKGLDVQLLSIFFFRFSLILLKYVYVHVSLCGYGHRSAGAYTEARVLGIKLRKSGRAASSPPLLSICVHLAEKSRFLLPRSRVLAASLPHLCFSCCAHHCADSH